MSQPAPTAVLTTCGPTFEPLDRVRRLTNFSTGRLGTLLANHLRQLGQASILLRGEQSTFRGAAEGVEVEEFTTTTDLLDRLRRRAATSARAVFHASAVADFSVGRLFRQLADGALAPVTEGKVATRGGTLLAELVPTPKILPQLRDFFPNAVIVGWKYEVDGSPEDVRVRGMEQLAACRTDYCVLNGPAYGPGFGVLSPDGSVVRAAGEGELFALLARVARLGDPAGNAG